MVLRIDIITTEAGFLNIAGEWDELLGQCPTPNVFMSHEWLYSWWVSYRPEGELTVVTAHDGPKLVGIAPLYLEWVRRFGSRLRQVRFIGDGTAETDHMDFLVHASAHETIRTSLLEAIGKLRWDVAQFNQVPESSATASHTRAFAGEHRCRLEVDAVPCPLRCLPDSYEALLGAMPSRFRSSLRSSRRKLEAEFEVRFGLHTCEADLPKALGILFTNHAKRWEAKGQGGVFTDSRKRQFYERLAPKLLSRGWLRFFFLEVDGKVVAQQFCFEMNRVLMLLQEGFDYEWAKYNVGNVLRAMVFEYLIEQDTRIYDFLAGSSRHKRNWADSEPTDLCLTLHRSIKSKACFLAVRSARSLRRQIKDFLPGQGA